MTELSIESAADEGLLGLVTRAERAIIEQTPDPVGVVRIEALEPTPEYPYVAVEAAFVERKGSGVVERLELHLGLDVVPDRAALTRLVGDAGDGDFTSLCLFAAERELVDVTLHFASRIKLFGRCTTLSSADLDAGQASACCHVLDALGLRATAGAGQLSVPGRRLGGPPGATDQVEALMRAREQGLGVELYASSLPVTRSVRVALDGARALFTLSRQIPAHATSIAADAVALREIAKRDLGFELTPCRWSVDNAHGQRDDHRPHAPLAGGGRVKWSLNWGARRG